MGMKTIPKAKRAAVVEEIRSRFRSYYPKMPPEKACLYWALITTQVLNQHCGRALIQAGSAFWPRMTEAQDDGVSPLNFGYQWDGTLPRPGVAMQECHVWCGLVEVNEIVDVTTRFFPEQCQRVLGIDWPGVQPPDYFWGTEDELPDRVRYHPEMEAIVYTLGLIRQGS